MEAPLRTSSYLIPVKLESESDKYMLIHGYTGAIDIATESLLKKIQSIASGTDLLPEMVEVLLKRGYITTKTPEEEYAYVARLVTALHQKAKVLTSCFTWVITYNCNFRCPYCFENRALKDGTQKFVLTKDEVDDIYAAINKIQPHEELRSKVMTLYGGEPLLTENKDIVSYIVTEGKKRGYKFKAITNGYDLDSYLDLLSPESIYKLQITIDGPKDIHNQRRIHYLYHNTFDKIVYNIELALKRGIEVIVRMNTDSYNINKLAELKHVFSTLGFDKYPNFSIYTAVLRDYDAISSSEYKDLDFISASSYINQHKQYKTLDLCYDYGISKHLQQAMLERKCITFRSAFCLAQINGYVFAPKGKIYPCWEVIGNDKNLIGTYSHKGLIWNTPVLEKWRGVDITKRKSCSQCKYALLCGGGCPAKTLEGQNVHCVFFQKMFDSSANRALMGCRNQIIQ